MTLSSGERVDVLLDLQHDLGKYLRLPLAMLPADADDDALREAARVALLRTRRGPDETVPAATLWAHFIAEAGDPAGTPAGDALIEAVERALAWAPRLEQPAPLDKGALLRDLSAVTAAIRALLHEATDEDADG